MFWAAVITIWNIRISLTDEERTVTSKTFVNDCLGINIRTDSCDEGPISTTDCLSGTFHEVNNVNYTSYEAQEYSLIDHASKLAIEFKTVFFSLSFSIQHVSFNLYKYIYLPAVTFIYDI